MLRKETNKSKNQTKCPICGSHDVEKTDEPREMMCYDCDTYWDYVNNEILHEGGK